MKHDTLLTGVEAAAILGVHKTTWLNWKKRGGITNYWLGERKRALFSKREVEELAKQLSKIKSFKPH